MCNNNLAGLRLAAAKAVAGLALVAFSARAQVDNGALVLLKGNNATELPSVVGELEGLGARVLHVFPPRALICSMPPAIEPAVLAHQWVESCHRAPVIVPSESEPLGDARLGIVSWNHLASPSAARVKSRGQPLVGDAFTPPAVSPKDSQTGSLVAEQGLSRRRQAGK